MDKPLVPREELRVLLHAASEIVFVFVNVAFSSSFFLFLSLTSRKRKSSKALARSLALSLSRSLARSDVSLHHALARSGKAQQRRGRKHRFRDPCFWSVVAAPSIVGNHQQWVRLRRLAILCRGPREGPPALRFLAADRGSGVCLG